MIKSMLLQLPMRFCACLTNRSTDVVSNTRDTSRIVYRGSNAFRRELIEVNHNNLQARSYGLLENLLSKLEVFSQQQQCRVAHHGAVQATEALRHSETDYLLLLR